MPISKNDFLQKGVKRAKVAGGTGVGPKVIASMKPDQAYSAAELAKFVGMQEPKKLKNILNYLTYRQKKLEGRVVNNEKYFLLTQKGAESQKK